MQGVYEIHFFEPLGAPQSDEQRASRGMPPRKPNTPYAVRHYIGFAEDIDRRIEAHRKGNGSALMKVVAERKIGWVVARIWLGKDKKWERHLKRQKNAPRLCPICNPGALANCACNERGEE